MIALACDHGAYDLKEAVKTHLAEKGLEVKDFGTYSTDSCDYPDFAAAAAKAVAAGECEKGVVLCTTGIGVSIVANKVKGIRCALCTDTFSAEMTRRHNNTNMLAFGARVVGIELAKMIVDSWLTGEYEGGRHQVRIDMLAEIEQRQKI